ncbi:sulfotransferase [Amphritea sp. HPY]|uniref:sulfotransferase n=1 Tax=Amphritea sp. HPY TaxID=3421652 RepID=UPI003D7DC3B3
MLPRITRKLNKALRSTFLFHLVKSTRKSHIYCIGTAKSGTHSIEALFGDELHSDHEPESDKVINMILAKAAGHISDAELGAYLLKRDRRLSLDIDSSQLNFFLLRKLVELFPDAKFILTIRNPYSWLDSFVNHQLARGGSEKWMKLRDLRFRPDIYTHQPGELLLKKKGLYTLDGYLSYWAHHNRTVIDTVPEDRLLIIRTDKITGHSEEIAGFAGISISSIRKEKSHAYKAKERFNLLDQVDQEYLEGKVQEHCGDLLAQFFPEIQSLEDAISNRTQ